MTVAACQRLPFDQSRLGKVNPADDLTREAAKA